MKHFQGIKICLYLLINTKIRLTSFELYSRWVPQTLVYEAVLNVDHVSDKCEEDCNTQKKLETMIMQNFEG